MKKNFFIIVSFILIILSLSNKSFDGRGNFALGLREQIVFPEIDYDAVDEMRGMDIVIVTSAKTDGEAKALLKGFNMPIN